MSENSNPAVEVAKSKREQGGSNVIERFGVTGRLVPVAAGLIQEATQRLEPPRPPVVHMTEKGRDEENPNDPEYLRELTRYNLKQVQIAIDTMVMFGVELDHLPDDDKWIKRLQFLQKRGGVDLTWVDWEDEIDREFVFKRYVFLTASDLQRVGQLTGVSEEAVQQAVNGF